MRVCLFTVDSPFCKTAYSLLYQASLSNRSNTAPSDIGTFLSIFLPSKFSSELQSAQNWATSSTFQRVPAKRAQTIAQPQPGPSASNENTYLMVNRSLPPPLPVKPNSVVRK